MILDTKDPKIAKLLAEEDLLLEITEKIVELMEKEGVDKTELAKRLGKSERYVICLLNGRNLSAREIADVFHSLGYRLKAVEEKHG